MTLQQGVELIDLQFRYGGAAAAATSPLLLDGFTLSLPPGARCLLVGANGAGKTTLLQVVAGHHMVPPDAVTVLGRPAFHDTSLASSGDLSYLGAAWRKDVAFAGYGVPLQGDLGAGEILSRVPGVDPSRREKLVRLLGIDPSWRLLRLSDGQRRRVQVAMGLLRPFKVLLLDEVTVDMDVLGRLDLLKFLADECEARGAIVVYATHIFDGLQGWATHLAHVSRGKLLRGGRVEDVAPEMTAAAAAATTTASAKEGGDKNSPSTSTKPPPPPPKLLTVVEAWLRSERDEARAEAAAAAAAAAKEAEKEKENSSSTPLEADAARKRDPAPSFPSRQMAFFR